MSSLKHLTIQHPPELGEKLPTVTLTHYVLDKIFQASMLYMGQETGEAMVGVTLSDKGEEFPRMYILETISPITTSVREWAMFEQGDDWQGAIFNWWHENWEMYRDWRRGSYGRAIAAKWDVPLQHLGDWHKQPDGMIHPSGGDMRTAQRLMKASDLDYLLIPIVTFETVTEELQTANTLAVATEQQRMRIDFWWVSRRNKRFEPVQPILAPNGSIPGLPPVVWWLADRDRFDEELRSLEDAELEVMDIISWSDNGRPPLDTCFMLYRPGAQHVIIACTPYDYPERAPHWRVAPIMRPDSDQDFFAALYRASQRAKLLSFKWKPELSLLDGVRAIEEQL